jgi:hypothetical protein
MSILQFIFDFYFAVALGVAGVAKADNFSSFILTLQYQYMIPKWGAEIIGRVFPWGEIFLATSLLMPPVAYRFIVTCGTLLVFIIFLVLKIILIKGKRFNSSCGCYGEITQRQISFQSMLTLIIQVVLVILLILLTLCSSSLPWQCYLVSLVLLIGFYSWLLWKTWKRQLAYVVGNN